MNTPEDSFSSHGNLVLYHACSDIERVVGSELEAKELLYQRICPLCLKEMAFEIDHGVELFEQDSKKGFEYRQAQLNELTLDDLLASPCGLEYWLETLETEDGKQYYVDD
jgi:hypothetical protein